MVSLRFFYFPAPIPAGFSCAIAFFLRDSTALSIASLSYRLERRVPKPAQRFEVETGQYMPRKRVGGIAAEKMKRLVPNLTVIGGFGERCVTFAASRMTFIELIGGFGASQKSLGTLGVEREQPEG